MLVFAITCVMLCVTAIPAFANKGEMQSITCYVLYVDDSYNLGYNYSDDAKWEFQYECQYSYCRSGSYNHSIKNSDIAAQKGKAESLLPEGEGWKIEGWSKTASSNPTIYNFSSSGTTTTQTSYTIYYVAKKATTKVVLDANGGVYSDGAPIKTLSGKAGADVTAASGYEVPTREGYNFLGWATTAAATSVLDKVVFGANGTTTYYAVWQAVPQAEEFTVVYYSYNNTEPNHTDTVSMDALKDGKYNVVEKVDSNYLYGGTFSDAACTTAYPFAGGENGMSFTPKANETYYVWELDAKYLAPRNYSIWRIMKDKPDQVHVTDVYMLFALDRLNYREAGFKVDVQKDSGGSFQSLNVYIDPYKSYKTVGSDMAYETIDVVRPNGDLEDFLYVKNGEIYNSNSKDVEHDPGYIVISKLSQEDYEKFAAGSLIYFTPYYTTVDGVSVTGPTTRRCSYRGEGDRTNDYYKLIDVENMDSKDDTLAESKAEGKVVFSSKLKLFRSRNGIMRSAGGFTVENGGVESASPKKPIFEKKMSMR